MPSVYQLFMPNNLEFITIKSTLKIKGRVIVEWKILPKILPVIYLFTDK